MAARRPDPWNHAAYLPPRQIGDPVASRALARARLVADLLDQRFRVPRTRIRFGLDTLAGIIPGVGDSVTTLIGLYPVAEAIRLGVPRRVVGRMLLNLGVDWCLGLVPVLDLVLDTVYKANIRNVRLLEDALRVMAPGRD